MATVFDIVNQAASHLGHPRLSNEEIVEHVDMEGTLVPRADDDGNWFPVDNPVSQQAHLWLVSITNEMLAAHNWTFTTRRSGALPLITNLSSNAGNTADPLYLTLGYYNNDWRYAYRWPADAIRIHYIIDPDTHTQEEMVTNTPFTVERLAVTDGDGVTRPTQSNTTIPNGNLMILSNAKDAQAVYSSNLGIDRIAADCVENFPRLPEYFTEALSVALAARMAFVVTRDLELKAGLTQLAQLQAQGAIQAEGMFIRAREQLPSEKVI